MKTDIHACRTTRLHPGRQAGRETYGHADRLTTRQAYKQTGRYIRAGNEYTGSTGRHRQTHASTADTGRHRRAHAGTSRHRQTQEEADTGSYRKTQADTGRHWQTQQQRISTDHYH
jgi:hypothetical protein